MARYTLTRRSALLLPLTLAACGGGEGDEVQSFPPLRFNYLPPLELNVASIIVEQRFVPAGVPPDVSNLDPEQPTDALKAMANDRLMAFGTENRAVFAILNASLTKEGDVITGIMEVSLTIQANNGAQLGYADAQVHSQHTGAVGNLRSTLFDITKAMMSDMNVEFEYQIRRNLQQWLTSSTAPDTPVQQTPLDQSGNPIPSQPETPSPAQPGGAPQDQSTVPPPTSLGSPVPVPPGNTAPTYLGGPPPALPGSPQPAPPSTLPVYPQPSVSP